MGIQKGICGLVLTGLLGLSMVAPACASGNEITTSGSGATSAVTLNVEASSFSVTVPTSLPVTVSADGSVTVATDAKIVNNSAGQVKVSNVEVSGKNGWTVIDYTNDLTSTAVNTRQIALSINGKTAVTEQSAMAGTFSVINGGSEQSFTYNANIPAQSSAITAGTEVASVIFTIGWNIAA